jgi:hypothetical protein
MSRIRPTLAALTALIAALLLVACGGSGGGSSGAVGSLLADTFGPHKSVHSGRLAVSVDLNLHGLKRLNGPVSFKLNGPFQGHGGKTLPEFNLSLVVGAGGQNFTAGIVSAHEKAWLNFAGSNYQVPDSLFQTFKNSYLKSAQDASKQKGTTFTAFGIQPGRWLTNAHKVGTEQVGGVDVVHITAAIDVARFLADVNKLLGKAGQLGVSGVSNAPTSISPQAQAAITAAVKSATVDVYTGSADHVLRRLTLAVNLDVPAQSRAAVGGLTNGTIGLDLVLSELNRSQQISAPSSSRPLSDLTGALGGGSSSSSGGGASSGGGSGINAPKPYLDCVTRAKGDVAAIQNCSSLLNAK